MTLQIIAQKRKWIKDFLPAGQRRCLVVKGDGARINEYILVNRARILQRQPSQYNKGRLPEHILIKIFSLLDIFQIMRMRAVSLHWSRLLNSSPDVLRHLDLSIYNSKVTNKALIDYICPFVGNRPWTIDISNCFHITDEGFAALTNQCGQNVRNWRMKSVWNVTPNAVLKMANNAKDLEEIDLSNCRNVSDNLLARIVGWVTDLHAPGQGQTVVGCPELKRLTLSHCKSVTDQTMAHLAVDAHTRLQSIDLTRCTTITDAGFQHWSTYKFTNLERVILADCDNLTDNTIVYLSNAVKGLKELDLVPPSFPPFMIYLLKIKK
jgi:F-box and leucine-rich repeat protein 7